MLLLILTINYQLKLQPDTSGKYVTAVSTTGAKYQKRGV